LSTSLEEMQQRVAKSQGQASATKPPRVSKPPAAGGGVTPLAEMQKRLAPPAPSLLQTIGGGLKDAATKAVLPYWQNYKETAKAYADSLSEDVTKSKSHQDSISGLLLSLKGLNDALGAAQAPLEAAGRTGILEPIRAGITKLGQLVSDHLAAPDVEPTPQQKRMAQVTGVPVARQYPKGIDWKVHKADVQQTVEGINAGLEQAFGAGLMLGEGKLLGGPKEPAPLPEPGSYEALPKLSPEEMEATIRANRRAQGLNPVVGKPKVEIGEIKPKVTLAQAQAGVRQATREMIEPMVAEPAAVVNAPKTNLMQAYSVHTAIDTMAVPIFEKYAKEGKPTTGGEILDQLKTITESIKGADAWTAVIEGLRKNVGDVKAHIAWQLPEWAQSISGDPIAGFYDHNSHSIHVSLQTADSPFHTTIHELEHAATAKYVRQNPDSPLVKRLDKVLNEARTRAVRMQEAQQAGKLVHYGLTNNREFLSELKSNPRFVDFLARSEAYASASWKSIKIFNYLADLFRQMLGIKDPRATPLLHESMFLGSEIAKKQAGGPKILAARQMTGEALRGAVELLPAQITKAQAKLESWYTDILKTVNVEALGPRAKLAASSVAKAIADRVRSTTMFVRNSEPRRMWWEARLSSVDQFISRFEKGDKFADDPELAKIADTYRHWNGMIFMQDIDHGILYDPVDNYLFHVFEDSDAVRQWADQTFGTKWGDPKFTKDRTFSLYEEAVKAGFVPRFRNPEDIMLARQKASDIAVSKIEALEQLDHFGLAVKKPSGVKNFSTRFPSVMRRSPNGDWYFIHQQAAQPLFNAFDSKSLWADTSLLGSAFRGGMAVKNTVVPLRLGFSLFHAGHVAHIANADMVALSSKGMLSGTQSPIEFGLSIAKAAPLFVNAWQNARFGQNIVDVWLGKVGYEDLTAADKQNLQFMSEGGFIPIMDQHWEVGAITKFRKAIANARDGDGLASARAVWHAPWALLEGMQAPIFKVWIPNLKAASYIKNVSEAIKADPSLMNNSLRRQQAFRRIAQSVDNRYGEMNYETLLWKKWAKDLAVLNTLSLGWQLGFLREYGGGTLDLGQFAVRGDKMQAIRQGKLDRALFASIYTITALGYGGLLTWAMTGKPPESLTDYILPRTGDVGPDGQPARVNTMFYTREFQSIYKHVEAKGLMAGLGNLVMSKASGIIGLFSELGRGVNSFGQEIRNPGDPAYQRIAESLAYVMSDLEPIAFKSMQGDLPSKLRAIAGFTPAPAYMTDSATVGRIKDSYQRFVAPQEKPYDRLARSKAFSQLRLDYLNGKPIGEKLDQLSSEFNLSGKEQRQLMRDLNRAGPPSGWMFQRLPWEEQKLLLDQMSPEERESYLSLSNKQHLRGHYAPPSP